MPTFVLPIDAPGHYIQRVSGQMRPAKRPVHHEELLYHPINDDFNTADCYPDWENDHAGEKRFFVGGLLWFLRETNLTTTDIGAVAGPNVPGAIADRTEWYKMPFSNTRWQQRVARKQVNKAQKVKAYQFHKAAGIIMACELALEDQLERGAKFDNLKSPEDIYTRMTIVPACWNIDGFGLDAFKQVEDSDTDAVNALLDRTAQPMKALKELANGHTVTRETAYLAHSELVNNSSFEVRIGRLRSHPGTSFLGKGEASVAERVAI